MPEDKLVTQIIPLQHASAGEVRKILVPMISRQGLLVAYAPTETLILADYASNIRRLLRIIKELDQPGADLKLNLIHLEYASAPKIAGYINKLLSVQKKLKENQPMAWPWQMRG